MIWCSAVFIVGLSVLSSNPTLTYFGHKLKFSLGLILPSETLDIFSGIYFASALWYWLYFLGDNLFSPSCQPRSFYNDSLALIEEKIEDNFDWSLVFFLLSSLSLFNFVTGKQRKVKVFAFLHAFKYLSVKHKELTLC